MSYDPQTGQWINDGQGTPPPQSYYPGASNNYYGGGQGYGDGTGYGTMPMPMQGQGGYSQAYPYGYGVTGGDIITPNQPSSQIGAANFGGTNSANPNDWISQALPQASQIRGASAGDASYWANLVPDFQQRYGQGWQQEMYQRMQGKGASGADAAPQGPFSAAAGYHYQPTASDYGGYGGSMGSYSGPAFNSPDPFTGFQSVNPGSFGYDPLNAPSNFQLPTGQQALDQDPGYQFRLQQGIDALQNSAASRGGLRDPNTARAIQDYGQQSASQEYGNAYNRALQTYQTNTGTGLAANQQQYQQGLGAYQANASTALQANQQNNTNALNAYQANFQDPLAAYQANVNAQLGFGSLGLQSQLGLGNLGVSQGYLGLAGDQQAFNQPYQLAQLGLQGTEASANTGLGYFNGLTNLYGNNANAMGNLYTGQGNANAAGQVGSGNAWQGALGNLGNLGLGLGAYAANRPKPVTPAPPPPPTSGGW